MSIKNTLNPFPGIRSYSVNESSYFYGRKKQVAILKEMLATHNFVIVSGASGCGKSSLINAGIIPEMNSAEEWITILFKPGNDPLNELVNAFISKSTKSFSDKETVNLQDLLTKEDGTFSRFIQSLFNSTQRIFLIIDQFEELFSYTGKNSQKRNSTFINHIIEAQKQDVIPLKTIVSMRTDFLDECTHFREFNDLINQSYYLVPEMTREEQRAAIKGPIEYFGAAIDENLVDILLNEVSEKKDQLPVLQHALMRTWEYWQRNSSNNEPISQVHYQAIGTVSSALNQHAEEVYNSLPDEKSKRIAGMVFRSLVNPNDGKNTRRSATVHELINLCNTDYQTLLEVINKFRVPECAFLMPPYQVSINEDTAINISHESIMRIWGRLNEWVLEERSSVDVYLRLVASAQLYQQGEGGLWVNPELNLALAWRDKMKPNACWGERINASFENAMNFLEISSQAFNTKIMLEKERQKRNLRRARYTSVFLGFASLISILFLVFSLNLRFEAEASAALARENEHLALAEKEKAEQQRKQAIIQTRISDQQREISNQQKLITEAQREYALSQQHVAERQTVIAETEREKALASQKEAIIARDEADMQRSKAVEQTIIANEQRTIAEKNEEKAFKLRMLSLAKALSVKANQMNKSQSDDLPRLLALQSYRLNKENGGLPYDPDIFNALSNISKNITFLRNHPDQIVAISQKKSSFFYSCSKDGTIAKWKIGEKGIEQLTTVFSPRQYYDIKSFAISDDENTSCLGTVDGGIIVIDNGTQEVTSFTLPNGNPVNKVLYDDKNNIVFTNGGKAIYSWSQNQESAPALLYSFDSDVTAIKTCHSAYLIGLDNGSFLRFDPFKMEVEDLYNKVMKPVSAIGCDSVTNSLSIGYEDGTLVFLGASSSSEPVKIDSHISRVTSIQYIHQGKYLATGSLDNTIKIRNTQNPESQPVIIQNHDGWVTSLAYDSGHKKIISGGLDRNIIIQSVDIEELAKKIKHDIKRELTSEEWNEYLGEDIPVVRTISEKYEKQ